MFSRASVDVDVRAGFFLFFTFVALRQPFSLVKVLRVALGWPLSCLKVLREGLRWPLSRLKVLVQGLGWPFSRLKVPVQPLGRPFSHQKVLGQPLGCLFLPPELPFRPRKHTVLSKEKVVLEKILRFFLQIHKSSLPLHRFPMGWRSQDDGINIRY